MMRILLVGSGGREHALAWKLRQSPKLTELFIAPGNGGTALLGRNTAVADYDIPGLLTLIADLRVDFVIPGPEHPLVLGLADACRDAGVRCFGPSRYAAQLEGSKVFAKNLMREAGVPTADFGVFTDSSQAGAYVRTHPGPLAVKADGLASGKGVVVARDSAEALAALDDMMTAKKFGRAGETVVLEECLTGEEVSFLCLCDDDIVVPLPSAQDHKAAFDSDLGPNTGGMGAYSPAPALPAERVPELVDLVIRPVLRVLRQRGHPFSGVLYAGLMMTAAGPKVLEYNVRFGDPECQPLLMRLNSDLLEMLLACAEHRLDGVRPDFSEEAALCVVMACEGYPGLYAAGMPVSGIEEAEASAWGQVKIFQAGTIRTEEGLVACGGRVLGVTALGATLQDARQRAYTAVGKIHMDKSRYRRDIGLKAVTRCGKERLEHP
jgi:phosphoribosylamine--glycine ligase